MKAIILAASRGNRLGELTEEIPKCLLPFGKNTILNRQIDILRKSAINIENIYVVAGFMSEKVKKSVKCNVIINDEYATTDNSYSLWLALNIIDDDVLIVDGDLVFDEKIFERILKSDFNAVLVKKEETIKESTGVSVRDDGRISEIGKHIQNEISYCGIAYIKQNTVSVLRKELEKNKYTWYSVALNIVINNIPFYAIYTDRKCCGVNTKYDYMSAKRLFDIEKVAIWVTGASGFLGSKVYNILKRNYTVYGTKGNRSDSDLTALDLLDFEAICAYIQLNKPTIIIHTAGIAEPERCRDNVERARAINVETVRNLVNAAQKFNIKFIHISTDYVFDGEKEESYCKNDQRKPKNIYGETKKEAENIVQKYSNSLIVRIPIIYGYNNDNDKKLFL